MGFYMLDQIRGRVGNQLSESESLASDRDLKNLLTLLRRTSLISFYEIVNLEIYGEYCYFFQMSLDKDLLAEVVAGCF